MNHNLLKKIWVTFIAAILLWVYSSYGQTYFSDTFRQLANSYSVWLFTSFVVWYYLNDKKLSIWAGWLIHIVSVFAYYLVSFLRFWLWYWSTWILLFWIWGWLLAGPFFWYAGYYVRNYSKYQHIAFGLLAWVFLSEGLYNLVTLWYIIEGSVFIVISIFLAWFFPKLLKKEWELANIFKIFLYAFFTWLFLFAIYAYILPFISDIIIYWSDYWRLKESWAI